MTRYSVDKFLRVTTIPMFLFSRNGISEWKWSDVPCNFIWEKIRLSTKHPDTHTITNVFYEYNLN